MRHHTFMRRSFTLLASAMAAAASGQALAETAGKVSFVTGNVTATTPDGQSRALRRGDAINGGDRIETRGGRLQIRFTDGGFVALQPNTVFGVDQYLYANKAPEETSLFFSLLRGGMRTVTGAIGKVNKQSYKVRTPVATIGIRGTGYRATTDNNRTLVSVGHGFVNVENALGNITAGAGQNILATNDVPPGLSREGAEIPATGPEGDNEQTTEESSGDTPRFGEQIIGNGDPLLLQRDASGNFVLLDPVVLSDTDPLTGQPLYSFIASSMFSAQTNLAATFDPLRQGGVLTLGDLNTNPVTPVFDAGTLQYNGVTTTGSISWGEFTNGTAATNTLSSTSTLSATQYEAYVVGVTPSPDVIPPSAIARYSLLGGTTPRLNLSTGGTLDAFKIDVDFVRSTIDVRLDLTMSGEQFMAKGSDIFIETLGQDVFDLSGLTTTSSGSSCFSFCYTNISGFFAGATRGQIGAAYNLNTGLGAITGTAGLGQGSLATYVSGSLAAPIYTVNGPSFLQLNNQAAFSKDGGLLTLVDGSGFTLFDAGTLQYNGIGKSGGLTWGEFTNGAADIDNLGSGLVASATQFEPYIFGTQSTTLVGHGSATYSLQGHSTPRVNQTTAATLNNFSITINFDLALMDLALGLTTGGLTANVSGSGMDVSNIFLDGAFSLSTSSFNQLSVSGSACASFCTADISGFFSGTGGAQIGAAYSVTTDTSQIKGVAALGMGTLQSGAGALPDDQLYTLATTAGSNPILGGYFNGDPMSPSLQADFNASGELVTADSVYPLTQTRLGNQTATVADAGTYKTLSWGRFTGGDVTVDGSTVTLSGPDSVHYVIGQETPGSMMNTLMSDGGTATYSNIGHSTPTGTNGVGTEFDGTLTVNFGAGTMAVDMDVLMPATTYSVTGNVGFSSAWFNGSGLTTTASSAGVCASGCSTDINGFFSGQQAQQIGLTYKINDFGGETIKGAAAFSRGDILPPQP